MNSILLFFSSVLAGVFTQNTSELTINITNIESIKGEIIIGVFNTDKNFLKDGSAIKNYSIKVENHSEQIIITDLPKGEYAISMYHDENSDNQCNRNFLGIPKEPYGFSNNIKPKFSAPAYEDCKFILDGEKELEIKLLN